MNFKYLVGKQFGNYKIKRKIGEGSFSTVFLVKETMNDDSNSPKYLACKVIPRKANDGKNLPSNLENEISLDQLNHHNNIVQFYDIQRDDNFFYIFEEFVSQGELLNKILYKSMLTEAESAFYFKQILIGLRYIHSLNVAHRDLKPDNILVGHNGTIKIVDFGLSKIFKDDGNCFTETPCGSLYYISPEVLSGRSYDSRKSDIWSCGVILYALATSFLPWTRSSQSLLFEQIKKGEYEIPFFLTFHCADLIKRFLTVDCDKRITIDEALNHPFLKKVELHDSKINSSLSWSNKFDKFPGFDDDFEHNEFFQLLSKEIYESDSEINLDLINIRRRNLTHNCITLKNMHEIRK